MAADARLSIDGLSVAGRSRADKSIPRFDRRQDGRPFGSLPRAQSGNPLSAHYDDLFTLWKRGEGVPSAWRPDEIRQAAIATLELIPSWRRSGWLANL